MNYSNLAPLIGLTITISGIIFKGGQMSQNIELNTFKVNAIEEKTNINLNNINQIYNTLSIIKTDLSYVKKDIHEMKIKLDKIN